MYTEAKDIIADGFFQKLEQPFSNIVIDQNAAELVIPIWNNKVLMGFQLFDCYIQSSQSIINAKKMDFPSQFHAASWVCSEQLRRDDLTESYRKYLIGKKCEFEFEIRAGRKQVLYSDGSFQSVEGRDSKLSISSNIAKPLGIATGTVLKYHVYSEAVDRVMSLEEKMAYMILLEEVRISHKNIVALSRQTDEKILEVCNEVRANNIRHIEEPLLLNKEAEQISETPATDETTEEDVPLIRMMPKYDPDAEISSLSLTIPSWISSIERADKHINYSKISIAARIKLAKQLAVLERTVYKMQLAIEEAN